MLNEWCPLEQCDFAFNLSKQVLVDELTDKQTLKMWFIEFLEAFAYLAQKSSQPWFIGNQNEEENTEYEYIAVNEHQHKTMDDEERVA